MKITIVNPRLEWVKQGKLKQSIVIGVFSLVCYNYRDMDHNPVKQRW